jgi:hypothetical protein
MTDQGYTWPANRQVLLNVGNRFVVFASPQTLPANSAFSPDELPPPLSRVPDEGDIYEQRTVESIRVSGAEVSSVDSGDRGWDFEIVDPQGNRTLVEMKVRNRDPKHSDYQQMLEHLRHYAESTNRHLEIWNLNIERLTLNILTQDDRGVSAPIELTPIDVWDYGVKGDEPFHRTRVLEKVDEWARRIDALYAAIERWASQRGLSVDRARTVTMSEQLMQRFAVPDRELPVLDIGRGDQLIMSFVPSGLWLIGAYGRIDVVTQEGTRAIVNLGAGSEAKWHLIEPHSRQPVPFDEAAFSSLVTPS